MISQQKKIILYSFLTLTLFIMPASSSWAQAATDFWSQDTTDDIKNFHENYDFDALSKRGEEMARQIEAGQVPGKMIYSESGFSFSQKFDPPGSLSEASFTAEFVDGRTTKSDLETGYAPGTDLEVEISLTVAKGSYVIEFQNSGEPPLRLEVQDGSSAEAKGIVTVGSNGALPFEVTAVQAEGVVMAMNVSVAAKPKE